jgi:hypothetical protein
MYLHTHDTSLINSFTNELLEERKEVAGSKYIFYPTVLGTGVLPEWDK